MSAGDAHVHTEWSWDAPHGSMENACARAVALGLPTIAFTDHADFVPWRVSDGIAAFLTDLGATVVDGVFQPVPFDTDGYHASIRECRSQFPGLEIQSAIELGEPHWYQADAGALLDAGEFDLVVAAVHSVRNSAGHPIEVSDAYLDRTPPEVVRAYLAEVEELIATWDRYDVLAHIDYAARSWPGSERPYRTEDFEGEYRTVLRVLAEADRALEINTRLPLDPVMVTWWLEEGGTSATLGSDVHDAHFLAQGFDAASVTITAHGFRPDPARIGFWRLA